MKKRLLIGIGILCGIALLAQHNLRNPATLSSLNTVFPAGGGGFTDPTSLDNLKGWWVGDNLSTNYNENDAMNDWVDASGLSTDLVQHGGRRPVFSNNVLNSHSGTWWTADQMSNSIIVPQPFTFIAVLKRNGVGANDTIFGTGAGSGDGTNLLFYGGSSATWNLEAPDQITDPSSHADATWYTLSVVVNGAGSLIRTNGVQAITGDPGDNPLIGFLLGFWDAATTRFDGWMVEVILYGDELTSGELGSVEGYLNTKCAHY